MEKYRVGVIGGTGMVGQRFVTLLENHPWFQLTAIAASSRSAGKTYEEAIGGRWALDVPMPGEAKDMVVLNAETDIDRIAVSHSNSRCSNNATRSFALAVLCFLSHSASSFFASTGCSASLIVFCSFAFFFSLTGSTVFKA